MVVTRITNNFLVQRTLADLQRNVRTLSQTQQQFSTGRLFSRPSDDPIGYTTALRYREHITEGRRFDRNINRALTTLSLTETNLGSTNEILQRVRELTLTGQNGTLDRAEYNTIADEVEELLDQVVSIANSNYEGVYLFAGTSTLRQPFERVGNAVRYTGNDGSRNLQVGVGVSLRSNLHGLETFLHTPQVLTGAVAVGDTSAALDTQLSATSPVPTSGDFTINGATITVDLTVDSLEAVRDRINAAQAGVEARIETGRLVLESRQSSDIVLEAGTSNLPAALGLTARIEGADLTGVVGGPIDVSTNLVAAGLDLEGLRLTVGDEEFLINLRSPLITTVGDVLNAINTSGADVTAFVNDAGTGISVISNTGDSVEMENIRSIFGQPVGLNLTTGTLLSSLGILTLGEIEIVTGTDSTIVDLNGAASFGEVLDRINNSTAGVRASMNPAGTGVDIESIDPNISFLEINNVGGGTTAGDLGIRQTRDANTATELGIVGSGKVPGTEGRDVFRTLTSIIEALRDGSTGAIASLGDQVANLDVDVETLLAARGEAGARVNRLEATQARLADLDTFLVELLSENEDVDLVEIFTRLTQQENTLQAALNAASRVITPTLLDFLR